MLVIRDATRSDKACIIEFLKKNWNEQHIFVKDTHLFDYYHLDGEGIDFVLAEDDGVLIATLGYIRYTYEQPVEQEDIHTVLWKNTGENMIGMKCLQYLIDKKYRTISSCGINLKTKGMYKFLGFQTGTLNHWYLLNTQIKQDAFQIARVNDLTSTTENILNKDKISDKSVRLIEGVSKILYETIQQSYPYKSYRYFEKKYLTHPYYRYIYYQVEDNGIETIVVMRQVDVAGAKCLRIVDIIGNPTGIGAIDFTALLYEKGYEYIDFYEIGMSEELLKGLGFKNRDVDDANVIPNYFEPFEQKNVSIHYMSNTKEHLYMFKGDGDQDRPSIAKKEWEIRK